MKQSTTTLDIQKQLLEVIGRINRNSDDIDKGLSGKSEIILLVGDTGAGKSTVFNLLCGAQFELKNDGIKDVLQIKKGTKNFSEMKHGTKSVTTEPKYHFIDEINHLIIDFPGFRDTRGEVEELVIQLLFNRIVTKNKVKLVYLVQQGLLSLPNRGTFVQDFLKIFKDQKFKFSDSILLLNSFALEEIEENIVVQNAKDELISITKDPDEQNQTICVIRNITASRLAELPNIRKKILLQIASSKSISFRPFEIKNVEIISKYLLRMSKALTDTIYDDLKGQIEVQIMGSDNETLVKLQIILRSMQQIKNKKKSEQYQKLFSIYEELTQGLGCKQKIDIHQNASFLKIYNYFEEFSDFIEGYNICVDNLEKIMDRTSLLDKQIEAKLAQSNLQKEQVRQLKQQQAEFQQQYQQMQQQLFEQMEKIRKEEKKIRDEQLQQVRKQSEQQLQMLQAQIAQSQQQNKGGGFLDKVLNFAQIALPIALRFI